jgi:hypothetical protein
MDPALEPDKSQSPIEDMGIILNAVPHSILSKLAKALHPLSQPKTLRVK